MKLSELNEWGRIVKGVNTTPDVDTDEIKVQAAKFGNTVDKDGKPPTLSKKVKGSSTNVLFNLGLAEGIILRLERDKHIDVLHVMDTKEKHRVEIRGKKGYESGNYDPQDKLHQVLDSVGKAANISELINGETVSINPNHPQGTRAIRTAQDVLQTEDKFTPMQLALMEGGHSIEESTIHTVEPGDTLYSLSRRYGVTVQQIQDWNNITNTNIRVGGELIVSEPDDSSVTRSLAPSSSPRPQLRPASFFNSYERLLIRVAKADGVEGEELAMLLAQCAHETRGYTAWVEAGSSRYFARYDRRYGNSQPGDGYRYRGRGYLHLTFKDNYRAAGNAIRMDLVNNPEMAERPYVAAQIALWFWNTRVKPRADVTNVRQVTRVINGGYNGLQSRTQYFNQYMNFIRLIDQEDGTFREIESIEEEWSEKYKRSINCSNPKGFSQKAHCAGRKKKESIKEWVCGKCYADPCTCESQTESLSNFFKVAFSGDPQFKAWYKMYKQDPEQAAKTFKNKHKEFLASMLTQVDENFADGKKKGKSRPGRVKRAGASCNGSVTSLRKRAKKASGEKAKMYHWCANMKSGRKKK